MKNMHATKKGPGRRPQRISTARYHLRNAAPEKLDALPADFSGAKLFRQAEQRRITLR